MPDSWVGGDIVKPLSKGVDKLVKDAGRKGEAAEKFGAAKFRTVAANLPKAYKLRGEWQATADQLDSLDGRPAGPENGSSPMPYDRYLNDETADVLRDGVFATAAVGGAGVVGVETFADKLFHEHWSEDWDDHGAVVGTPYGIGHWDRGVACGRGYGDRRRPLDRRQVQGAGAQDLPMLVGTT